MTETVTDADIHLLNIDDAIKRAAHLMDLDDVDDEEAYLDMSEMRFHCGKCVVRTVMEEVWPSVQTYLDHLTDQRDAAAAVVTAVQQWLTDPTDLTFSTLTHTIDLYSRQDAPHDDR